MNELIETIKEDLRDEETRYVYAEDLLNTYIATQIKILREKKGWTQAVLAEQAGMKQERISVLEDVNYESWTANVLKRLARALDVRLSIKFEDFGSYLKEVANLNRAELDRCFFADDPIFKQLPIQKSKDIKAEFSDLDLANAPAGLIHTTLIGDMIEPQKPPLGFDKPKTKRGDKKRRTDRHERRPGRSGNQASRHRVSSANTEIAV